MIYEIVDGVVKVFDKSQFNPQHILECGQVFRFGKNADGNYYVISLDKKATILEKDDCFEIVSNDADYFVNYFDLNADYNQMKLKLCCDEILRPMIDSGYGIRILNSNNFEMIFSYIISQNNNIKRIQMIIERLCKVGTKIDDYYAFPTIEQLAKQNEEFFASLGAGYRDKFLFGAVKSLQNVNLDEIDALPSDELFKFLLSIKGIGPKVASCILLFGFGRKDYFPVDTWIEQVYYKHYSNEKRTRPQIQKYFEEKYKNLSGLAQQYLFFFERSKK